MRFRKGDRVVPVFAAHKAGVITEVRKREFYEKPTEERKRKAAAAVKRNYKRVMKDSFAKLK